MTPPDRPVQRKAAWVIAAIVASLLIAALGAWFGHLQGQRTAGHDAAREASAQRMLAAQLESVEAENKTLHARVAELEMARRLDRDAYGQVERTLGDLQSQLARQSDDLAFYRSIVSPADGIQGLRIQRFEVLPGTRPVEFVLKLTLVQAMRHDSVVSGLAQITVSGMRDGAPARYTVGELLGRPRAQLPFSFRYFQAVEQAVVLPEGFEPYAVDVRLQSSKLPRPVQQAFPWDPRATAAL